MKTVKLIKHVSSGLMIGLTLFLAGCQGGSGLHQNPLRNYGSLNNAIPDGTGAQEGTKLVATNGYDIIAVDDQGRRWGSLDPRTNSIILETTEGETPKFTFIPVFSDLIDTTKLVYSISLKTNSTQLPPNTVAVPVARNKTTSRNSSDLQISLNNTNNIVAGGEPFQAYSVIVTLNIDPSTPVDIRSKLQRDPQQTFSLRVFRPSGAKSAISITDGQYSPKIVLPPFGQATVSFHVTDPAANDPSQLICSVVQTGLVPNGEANNVDGFLGVPTLPTGVKTGNHEFTYTFSFNAQQFLNNIKKKNITLAELQTDAPSYYISAQPVFRCTDTYTTVVSASVSLPDDGILVSPNAGPGKPKLLAPVVVPLAQGAGSQSGNFQIMADNMTGDLRVLEINGEKPTGNNSFILSKVAGSPQVQCTPTNQVRGEETCLGQCLNVCTITWSIGCDFKQSSLNLSVSAQASYQTPSSNEQGKPQTVQINIPVERDTAKCPSTTKVAAGKTREKKS
jgi:hypothetical protein